MVIDLADSNGVLKFDDNVLQFWNKIGTDLLKFGPSHAQNCLLPNLNLEIRGSKVSYIHWNHSLNHTTTIGTIGTIFLHNIENRSADFAELLLATVFEQNYTIELYQPDFT